MRRLSVSGFALWSLSIFSLLLFVQAVLKDNKELIAHPPKWLVSWKVLSAEAATTLLAGFITLMAAKLQFQLSTKPVLSVTIGDDDTEDRELRDHIPTRWRANLRNRGSGMALIKKISYFVRRKTGNLILEAEMNRDELYAILLAAGFVESKDFSLPRIVAEATLESQGSTVLFAYNKAIFDSFWIEAQFEYAGILGDTYLKDVPCLARESALNPANSFKTSPAPAPSST